MPSGSLSGVLYETLFDPLLSAPEVGALPAVLELGSEVGDADLIFFWLTHGG